MIRDEYWPRIEELSVRDKSPRNTVTEADLAAERWIREKIFDAFPEHGIVGEEMEETAGHDVIWYIDPLDGTTNFAAGIPHWSVSVAAYDGNGGIAGVVYDPLREECFTASRRGGAFLNERPLRMNPVSHLEDALVATGFAATRGEKPRYEAAEMVAVLLPLVRGLRRMGSAALDLAYVACGRFDLFFEDGLFPWDLAAGGLIVLEAGGLVSDFDTDDSLDSVRPRLFDTGRILVSGKKLAMEFRGKVLGQVDWRVGKEKS